MTCLYSRLHVTVPVVSKRQCADAHVLVLRVDVSPSCAFRSMLRGTALLHDVCLLKVCSVFPTELSTNSVLGNPGVWEFFLALGFARLQ